MQRLFSLEEIKEQLNEEEIKKLKRVLIVAEETGKPQEVFSDLGLRIAVFPSGKMCNLNSVPSEGT
jgi:hypothetical protein